MLFIMTLNRDCEVGFAPYQHGGTLDSKVIDFLSEPLPLAVIQIVKEELQKKYFFHPWGKKKSPELTKKRIMKVLKKLLGDTGKYTWKGVSGENFCHAVEGQALKGNGECFDFNQVVRGKQLSSGDLQRIAKDLGVKPDIIMQLAHYNVQEGWADWVPSVKQAGGEWQCQRCGEKDLEEWPSCYGRTLTCRSCESLGSSTSLDVFYRDKRRLLSHPAKVIFQPHWSLTEAQRQASNQVLEFVKHSSKEALLWAACGAGKTEVCFPAAAWALKQGKSVLFAAPRQDVIHDIEPRFRKDFPGYPLQVLTGVITNKLQAGGMVLATTHQVLRFHRSFDVIFMDEIDAFPYHGSRALEWGLKQALSEEGKLLFLTATPTPERLEAVENGEISLIRLPSRHHRNPLPVPIWVKSGKCLEAYAGSIEQMTQHLELLRTEGPVLVFVPKISWVLPWVKGLKQRYPGWRINGSYSADPERSKKINDLQQGRYDIFVSTTILERGITLPGIQVAVLGADHPVFDERALVQMAGRVGRTSDRPGGNVLFIAQQRTNSMKRAVEWIEEQNRQGFKLGLIDYGERR